MWLRFTQLCPAAVAVLMSSPRACSSSVVQVCSRSGQSHPRPKGGATESRKPRTAAPGRYCRSSAWGQSRWRPGRFSRPATPGWSSQEHLRPAEGADQGHWCAKRSNKNTNFIASLLETGSQIKTSEAKNWNKPTYFVETGNNMAEVDPGCSCFRHLVEQVIPEELQQVAVSGLRPCWVLLEPDAPNTRLRSQDSKTLHPRSGQSGSDTYSGRSLMVPSLANKRKRRPFWTSCRQRFWLLISTILTFMVQMCLNRHKRSKIIPTST